MLLCCDDPNTSCSPALLPHRKCKMQENCWLSLKIVSHSGFQTLTCLESVKTDCWAIRALSDSVGLAWKPKTFMSNKWPDDVDVVVQRSLLRTTVSTRIRLFWVEMEPVGLSGDTDGRSCPLVVGCSKDQAHSAARGSSWLQAQGWVGLSFIFFSSTWEFCPLMRPLTGPRNARSGSFPGADLHAEMDRPCVTGGASCQEGSGFPSLHLFSSLGAVTSQLGGPVCTSHTVPKPHSFHLHSMGQ
jgi:hypothetical protein